MKSEGGYVWACKNYDGDVQSDLLAQGAVENLAKHYCVSDFYYLYIEYFHLICIVAIFLFQVFAISYVGFLSCTTFDSIKWTCSSFSL